MKKWIILVGVMMLIFPVTVLAVPNLDQINQKVCNRFEEDILRLAAIMEEVRQRKGITETRVAFGGIDTPIKAADYQITYAAEALSYQKVQKFSSKQELKYSLQILANKILKAKAEVKKALNE